MKCTKALAIMAVALMLAVPLAIIFTADVNISAEDKKNKTVNGLSAYYSKTDKELSREKLIELYSPEDLQIMMGFAVTGTGLNSSLFLNNSAIQKVNTFKVTYIEEGAACKVADDTFTDTTVTKVKGEYDITYKFPTAHSYKEFIKNAGSDAKTAEAAEAFKAYFGETIAAETEITLSAKFDIQISTIDIEKYVNISTGELVLSMHKITLNTVAKIDDGKLKIGDKTMAISVNDAISETKGFDYSIGSDAKLDTKLEKASIIWDASGNVLQKYKFGDKEVVYSPDTKECLSDEYKEKEALEKHIEEAKKLAVGQGLDYLMPFEETFGSIIRSMDVEVTEHSWKSGQEQKFKDSGFTTSSNNFDDVLNAANSVNASSGKSPVLFIVIAVVAVIVVAGAVFVVMKKKSA